MVCRRASWNAQLVDPCHGQLKVGKTSPGPTNPRFLLRHVDGRVRSWRKQHESMDPSCPLQAGGGGVLVWGMLSWHTLGPLIPIEQQTFTTPPGCSGGKGESDPVYFLVHPVLYACSFPSSCRNVYQWHAHIFVRKYTVHSKHL